MPESFNYKTDVAPVVSPRNLNNSDYPTQFIISPNYMVSFILSPKLGHIQNANQDKLKHFFPLFQTAAALYGFPICTHTT